MLNLECANSTRSERDWEPWGTLLSRYPGTQVLKGKGIPDLDGVASTAQERLLRNLHPTAVAPGTVSGSQEAHVSEMCQPGCSELSFNR